MSFIWDSSNAEFIKGKKINGTPSDNDIIKFNAATDEFDFEVDVSGGGGADADAIHDNVAAEISAIAAKGTPIAGDFFIIEDSADGDAKKSVLFSALESSLNHDNLAGFVLGEHFLQSAITVVGTVVTGNVTAVVSAATTSLAGKLEIPTTAEIDTSTANRAMTPDLFKASDFGRKTVPIVLFGTETVVTTLTIGTDDLPEFVVPASMVGWELIDVIVGVFDKGITGATTVNVNRRRAGANVAMLSTGVTVGDEFFASDGTVDTSNDELALGDTIAAYITGIHSGTAPNGLTVTMTFEQP